MMRSLFLKTLYDKRWFMLGWSAMMFFMVFLLLSFYPSLSKSNTFDQLSGTVPEQLKVFIGDPSSFHTLKGYIATQLYDIRVPLLLMIMALVLAQGLAAGDEEKGTLRTLLATPLSRGRIAWERWAAGAAIVGIAVVPTVIGAYVGAAIIKEPVPADMIWRLALLSWLFGTAAFSLTYAVGLASGKRGLMMAFGLGVTFGSFVISSFAKAVDWLEPFKYVSLLNYYDTQSISDGEFNIGGMILLAALIALFMSLAHLLFRRRDVS